MTQDMPDPKAIAALQTEITAFLAARLAEKVKKLTAEDVADLEAAKAKLAESFLPQHWIADAACRAGQLQQITHASKYTHPDNKASSCYSTGNPAAGKHVLGTHTLAGVLTPDVVGNAAALDVYKFLRLGYAGQTLLDLATASAPLLRAVFSTCGSADEADNWMQAFASLRQPDPQPVAHTLAKQVYWPLPTGGYHLLAPLFPTTLAHVLYERINHDRFSDAAKAARAARRAKSTHPHGYADYPGLAITRFGGTKAQNISQLNSERRGEAYLLPALPPAWRSESVRAPLHVASLFAGTFSPFARRRAVRDILRQWKDFLARLAGNPISNLAIRQHRERLLAALIDELLQYAAEIRTLPAGWSQDAACKLSPAEICWLDPQGAANAPALAALYQRGDWQVPLCQRFGNWLNARLESKNVVLGEAESGYWQRALAKELKLLQQEVAHHD